MSSSSHEFDLTFKTKGANESFRDLQKIINSLTLAQQGLKGYLLLIRRMNLPENVEASVNILYGMITVVNALRSALIALQAASGPIGWLMLGAGAAVGVGTFVMSQMEMDARTGNY